MHLLSKHNHKLFENIVAGAQDRYARAMDVDEGIAMNEALSENGRQTIIIHF
jgi:hypothetical protein